MKIDFIRYNFGKELKRTSARRITLSYWITFVLITDNIEPTEDDVLDFIERKNLEPTEKEVIEFEEREDIEWIESNRGIDEKKNNS